MSKKIYSVNVKNATEKRKIALSEAIKNIESCLQIHISMGNSKMPIPSFSVLPLITCAGCADCANYCYAAKARFNFPDNIKSLAENTALMMYKPEEVEKQVNSFLDGQLVIYKYFRWNVAGDVFNKSYLDVIGRVAQNNPMTRFLVFTKNFNLFNLYFDGVQKPGNLSIIFSRWDNAIIDNPHNFPLAITKINDDTIIPDGTKKCAGSCETCLNCWNESDNGTARYFELH